MFDPMRARLRVVVLEERNERGGNADELAWRYVHVADAHRRLHLEAFTEPDRHALLRELIVLRQDCVGLRDRELLLPRLR